MANRECPVCDSTNTKIVTEETPYSPFYGPTVQLEDLVCHCLDCEESTIVGGEKYRKRTHEMIRDADMKSIQEMLNWLSSIGITAAHIEGVLGLPPRTINNWKSVGYSASSIVLIRLIRTFPWLLETVSRDYEEHMVSKINDLAVNEVLFKEAATDAKVIELGNHSPTYELMGHSIVAAM